MDSMPFKRVTLSGILAIASFVGGACGDELPLSLLSSDDSISVIPNNCDALCAADLASKADGAITFQPVSGDANDTGLLYFPAEGVDARMYSAIARGVAEHGYVVALLPFANSTSLEDSLFRAEKVIEMHATVKTWAVAGHGEGAVAAAQVANSTSVVKGLALHGSDPISDLSGVNPEDLMVYAFKGSVAGYETPSDFKSTILPKLPAHTVQVSLPGATFSGFSHSPSSPTEPAATMPRELQQQIVADATAHLLLQFSTPLGENVSEEPLVHADTRVVETNLCKLTQYEVAGVEPNALNVTVNEIPEESVFMTTNLSTLTDNAQLLSHDAIRGNPTLKYGPPVYVAQTFCKLHSYDAVGALVDATSKGACQSMNEKVFMDVLYEQVPWFTRTLFLNWANGKVSFKEDRSVAKEDWLTSVTNHATHTSSSRWEFEYESDVFESADTLYCKVLNYEGAVHLIEKIAFGPGYKAFMDYKEGETGGIRNEQDPQDDSPMKYIIGAIGGGLSMGAVVMVVKANSHYGLKRRAKKKPVSSEGQDGEMSPEVECEKDHLSISNDGDTGSDEV